MKYLELSSYTTTLSVSRLAFGTGSNLRSLSNEEIHLLMDQYIDAGGNCMDSARGYLEGRSEEVLGEWLTSRKNRDKVLISTKAGHPGPGSDLPAKLSRKELVVDLNESLKTLGTDYIDIFWLHKDDPNRPVEEIIDSVNSIIASGKVRMVGCSNWSVQRIEAAEAYANMSGQHGFLASQIQWSLAQTLEENFTSMGVKVMDPASYAWYLSRNMPVFAFSAQAMGFFAKVASGGPDSLTEEMRFRYASQENLARADRVIQFATERGISVSQAVLAYIINNQLPGIAVISSKSSEHLLDSLSASEVSMTSQEADSLFEV